MNRLLEKVTCPSSLNPDDTVRKPETQFWAGANPMALGTLRGPGSVMVQVQVNAGKREMAFKVGCTEQGENVKDMLLPGAVLLGGSIQRSYIGGLNFLSGLV